jgi:hypothetical protein
LNETENYQIIKGGFSMVNQIEQFLARILNFYAHSIRNLPILSAISLIVLSALSYLPYYFGVKRGWRVARQLKKMFKFWFCIIIISFIIIKIWQYLPIEAMIIDTKNKWQQFIN